MLFQKIWITIIQKKKIIFGKKILLYYWLNNIKNYFGIYDIKNKGYILLAKKSISPIYVPKITASGTFQIIIILKIEHNIYIR